MAVWNLFFSTLLLPLIAIALLWRRARRPPGPWIATFLLAAGISGFSFFAAPWGWFGLPLRWLLAALFAAALATSLISRREGAEESPMRMLVKSMIGLFFGSVAIGALAARAVPPGALDAGFPLRGGTFLVMHGGSAPAANVHPAEPSRRYAVDFVQLGTFGFRARGILPRDPHRYAVFGATVVAPCDGTILAAAGDLPDSGTDAAHPLGNALTLRCNDTDVTLAHLQRGSLSVRVRDSVVRGTPIARAGNSGASPEPHLSIHAERKGQPVPLTFEGKWLVRNAVVRR
ncbi:MAG TPA: M23 family metallopeptidase [Thermoanaerobaculia bacterium]